MHTDIHIEPVAVDGATLLEDIAKFISRFVVLTPAQADACALWVIHTHALEAAEFTPYLHIHSPMPRSGKTLLLDVLNLLAAKPWMTGRVTGAVLVRKTAKERPTLLLDESDAAFQSDHECAETLRGILNTGFQRNGRFSICVKGANDWGCQDFPTFSPRAIAGIGRLPLTIEDRSIPIELKRKRRKERCERFRSRRIRPEAKILYDLAERWAELNVSTLRNAEPTLPDELNDRQQDVCEPLLAIADRMGGDWPSRARQALVELFSNIPASDDSLPVRLLADIRAVFEHCSSDKMSSRDLLRKLVDDESSPWAELKGKPMSAPQLAQMLRPFGITPRDLRIGPKTLKGYHRANFEDSWGRYLPNSTATPITEGQQGQQPNVYAGSNQYSEGQRAHPAADVEVGGQADTMQVVADVAPPTPAKKVGGDRKARVRVCWDHPFDASWRQDSDGTWICGHC